MASCGFHFSTHHRGVVSPAVPQGRNRGDHRKLALSEETADSDPMDSLEGSLPGILSV